MTTYLIDTREQRPYALEPAERVALETGDYSVMGLEGVVTVERKSLGDLVACCGRERERFLRELERLRGYPYGAVVVEADWGDLSKGEWRGRVSVETVRSSVCSWSARYCPFLLVGDRRGGRSAVKRFLDAVVRERLREVRALTGPGPVKRKRAARPKRKTAIGW